MDTHKSVWKRLLDWTGQSVVDKIVTLGLGVLATATGIVARKIEPGTLQQALIFLGVLSGLAFVAVLYVNHRSARLQAQLDHHLDLFQVMGFIVRHRINETPRTSLDRHIQFTNPADRVKAVEDTVKAHQQEVEEWISQANPDVPLTTIRRLLDVFYGQE